MNDMLYPWQEECLRQWQLHGGRGIVEAVTGSGKTRMALEACRRLEEKLQKENRDGQPQKNQQDAGRLFIKIVVPTAALMRQWSRALRGFWNARSQTAEIGLCGGGRKPETEKAYMIYVVNSARYTLARQILEDLKRGDSVLLIADECHHYVSGQNRLIFEFRDHMAGYEKQYFALGLSATLPSGEAKAALSAALGAPVYFYGLRRALAARTVCSYDIFHIALPFSPEERTEYEDLTDRMQAVFQKLLKARPDFTRCTMQELYEELRSLAADKKARCAKEAELYLRLTWRRREAVCLASARTECTVQLLRLLGTRKRILVFGERIRQIEDLYGRLQRLFPGKIGRYHSAMGETANRNTLERFRDGEIRILLVCRSLDEGFDVPEVSVGIILSGTSSQRQRTQRLGRVIRQAKGKEHAALYYLHVEESAEDDRFLPGSEQNRIFELEYSPVTKEFRQETYEQASEIVWQKMGGGRMEQKRQEEFSRCAAFGSVRADWMDAPEVLEKKLNEASGRKRNYWILMMKISRIVREQDDGEDCNKPAEETKDGRDCKRPTGETQDSCPCDKQVRETERRPKLQ